MNGAPAVSTNPAGVADAIIERVGRQIVLGLPLGIGKANHIANALFERAAADPEIELTILTALTLEPPRAGNELARRFLEPIADRFFAGYPRLRYAESLATGDLPRNIRVREFFLQPGYWLGNPRVQQDYVSLNYTHVLRYLLDAGINVVAQLIASPEGAERGRPATRYSLSCNPDLSADLLELRRAGDLQCLFAGQVNPTLPFMHGAADEFDLILDSPDCDFPLYAPPHEPVSYVEHAIGLNVAALVPDGGTLQIGIGSIGDAIAHALILRHRHNALFKELSDALAMPADISYSGTFEDGLYGLSEMLVEGFIELIHAGVLKRRVQDCVMHAAFFMGSPLFNRALAELDDDRRREIGMMPVSFVNEVYGGEDRKRRDRKHARFINSALMCTLTGAVVSDGLEDGRVISGVGGQYNFVEQAFALPDARSVITLRATRTRRGTAESNIRWNYGHVTIPRHLRDIVVTEYGVADLRGKSDADVIAAMLNIADSRFQDDLLDAARAAGKLPRNFRIPDRHRENSPARIATALQPYRRAGHLPVFPLGSDLTASEQRLAPALEILAEQAGSLPALSRLAVEGLRTRAEGALREDLARLQLDRPGSPADWFSRQLVKAALARDT